MFKALCGWRHSIEIALFLVCSVARIAYADNWGIGMNDIKDVAHSGNKCTKPSVMRIYRLHIRTKFLRDLDISKQCRDCVTYADIKKDNNIYVEDFNHPETGSGEPIPAHEAHASHEWNTPLDVVVPPGDVLIKIILDDRNLSFIRANPANFENSDQAIFADNEGAGSFYCRSPIMYDERVSPNATHVESLQVLRKATNKRVGLNIGIVVRKEGSTQDESLGLPLYVDPKVHNGGRPTSTEEQRSPQR
jgi:hypothetical protein